MVELVRRACRFCRRLLSREKHLSAEEQYAAWVADIERINKETAYAFENRLIFRYIQELYRNNQDLQDRGGLIYDWIFGMYGRDQVLAVRREADRSSDVVNLMRLIYQISKRPEVITRKRWLAHFAGPGNFVPLKEQNEQFDRFCGTGACIDVTMVKRDRRKLERVTKVVVRYGNKMVAHRAELDIKLVLSQKDVHDAMDAIEEMLKKYYLILTARALVQAEPTIQFAWKHVFDIPWRKKT